MVKIFYRAENKKDHERLESAMEKLHEEYSIQTKSNLEISLGSLEEIRIHPLDEKIEEVIQLKPESRGATLKRLTPKYDFAIILLGDTTYQINFNSSVKA